MRHIILSSVLLSLPLAVVAQDEQQTTQSQDQQAQDQQVQDQQPQTQPVSATQQSSREQEQSRTVAAGESDAKPEAERAQFTSNVENREPVDEVSEFQAGDETLYFFTEIKNGAGQTITHRWTRDGEVVAEVPLEVGSDSWRTWSSKELMPDWEGDWTVEVVDASGNTIAEESITIDAASAEAQNVGYSPDEQDQESQEASTGAAQGDDQGAQTMQTGASSQGGMQSTTAEQIDYAPEENMQSTSAEQIDYTTEDQSSEDASEDSMQQGRR